MKQDCKELFDHFGKVQDYFSNDILIVINQSTAYVSSNCLSDGFEKMNVKELMDRLSIFAVKKGIEHNFFDKGDWLNDPVCGDYEDIIGATRQDIHVDPVYWNLLFLVAAMINNNMEKDNIYSVISFTYEGDCIAYRECEGEEGLKEVISEWFKD